MYYLVKNALKFKKGAPLKQLFNINLGIGIIKKLLFLFVFSTYLPMFLLKFGLRDLVGCKTKFRIQWVPTRHTFDGPRYPQNKKYLKKMWWWHHRHVFFHVFLIFGVAGLVKSMPSGYSLDAKFNSSSNELSRSKFE